MLYRTKFFLSLIFLTATLLTGCATARGLSEGLSKDAKDTWTFLTHADAWMKKNLW